uniref:DNA-directed RNA polymerase subunit beta n=1 Tax=Lygus hesperus TaxID=30085 RepID=A0A0A9YH58_LYGHE
MGASHSRYGRCMPGSNSNQSVIPRLEAKPPSVNLQGGQGESSSAVTTAGPAGNSELGDAANVFVVDSGEDTSNEYLTILDDETGLTLQDVSFHSCTSVVSGLGSRHQLQSPQEVPQAGQSQLQSPQSTTSSSD